MPPPQTLSAPETAWHALVTEEVIRRLASDPVAGLATEEAEQRHAAHGPNRLAEKPPRPAWLKFLDQFRNVLVLILIGAAVLAGAIGDLKDAMVITVVVLLNAALGFFQEHRAEAALAALKNMLAPTARVRRDGEVHLIEAEQREAREAVTAARDHIEADLHQEMRRLREEIADLRAALPARDKPS